MNWAPWAIGGGIVLGLVMLLARGSGGSTTSTTGLAATLQSMGMASQANIALAGIAAQKEAELSKHALAYRLGLVDKQIRDNLVAKEFAYRMAELQTRENIARLYV